MRITGTFWLFDEQQYILGLFHYQEQSTFPLALTPKHDQGQDSNIGVNSTNSHLFVTF